jgi:ABC-type molybdate transport system substrate-binding protein
MRSAPDGELRLVIKLALAIKCLGAAPAVMHRRFFPLPETVAQGMPKIASHIAAAQAFLTFFSSPEGQQIFAKYGFVDASAG